MIHHAKPGDRLRQGVNWDATFGFKLILMVGRVKMRFRVRPLPHGPTRGQRVLAWLLGTVHFAIYWRGDSPPLVIPLDRLI